MIMLLAKFGAVVLFLGACLFLGGIVAVLCDTREKRTRRDPLSERKLREVSKRLHRHEERWI